MSIATTDFQDDLADLESAEDFLNYFGIDFVPSVVQVNRLHILQRYHDYLDGHRERGGDFSYEDFVHSDARTEKVMRVYQKVSGIARVAVSSIGRSKT